MGTEYMREEASMLVWVAGAVARGRDTRALGCTCATKPRCWERLAAPDVRAPEPSGSSVFPASDCHIFLITAGHLTINLHYVHPPVFVAIPQLGSGYEVRGPKSGRPP